MNPLYFSHGPMDEQGFAFHETAEEAIARCEAMMKELDEYYGENETRYGGDESTCWGRILAHAIKKDNHPDRAGMPDSLKMLVMPPMGVPDKRNSGGDI